MQPTAATSPFPLVAAFGTVTWGERPGAKTRVRGIGLAPGAGAWAIGFQVWEGTWEKSTATTKPRWAASSFGFTGREHELDSGLVYARDRYLASATGRWTQPDRLGVVAGVNFFTYVNGQPTRLIDPTGQLPVLLLPLFGAAIGGIFGLLGGMVSGFSKLQLVEAFVAGAMIGAMAVYDVIGLVLPMFKAPIVTAAISNAIFMALGNIAAQVIATGSIQSWTSVIISALFGALTTVLAGMSRFGLRDVARGLTRDFGMGFTVKDIFSLLPSFGAAQFDFILQVVLVPVFYHMEQRARIEAMFHEGEVCLPI